MKTTNELHDIIQKLRDAVIEAKCMAAVWKTQAHVIPDAVNSTLAEMEEHLAKVLEKNKAW